MAEAECRAESRVCVMCIWGESIFLKVAASVVNGVCYSAGDAIFGLFGPRSNVCRLKNDVLTIHPKNSVLIILTATRVIQERETAGCFPEHHISKNFRRG